MRRLAATPSGIRLGAGSSAGSLVAASTAAAGSVSALAVPRDPPTDVVPVPLLLVMGLLLVFAVLAGWIHTGGQPPQGRSASGRSLVLLALVPVLTAGAFMVQTTRLFREHAAEANVRDLTRGLAVASVRRVTNSPGDVKRLTGFDATVVRGGRIESSTFEVPGDELGPLASLSAPPASFIASGRVATPAGEAAYVALRLEGRAFVVATAPDPEERIAAYGARARVVALAFGGWLALVAAVLGMLLLPLRSRRRAERATGLSSGR